MRKAYIGVYRIDTKEKSKFSGFFSFFPYCIKQKAAFTPCFKQTARRQTFYTLCFYRTRRCNVSISPEQPQSSNCKHQHFDGIRKIRPFYIAGSKPLFVLYFIKSIETLLLLYKRDPRKLTEFTHKLPLFAPNFPRRTKFLCLLFKKIQSADIRKGKKYF
jgi:hypothetical protein